MGEEAVERIFALFHTSGDQMYIGEPVTVSEHMLQAAALAVADGADDQLIAAALLHDIGHLTHDLPEDAADHGVDTRHEDNAMAVLQPLFPAAVTEPIRLHVAAKRYLVATDPRYLQSLSPASLQSLALQGGPMSHDERTAFESLPHATAACRLRRYDDAAKDTAVSTPPLESYAGLLRSVLRH